MSYTLFAYVIAVGAIGCSVAFYFRVRSFLRYNLEKQTDLTRKMYHLSVLKELHERVGYTLDVQKIIEIIVGSIKQLIEYSVVSYMLMEHEHIAFNVHLEDSVSRDYIDDLRERMLASLTVLIGKDFKKDNIRELLSGVIIERERETKLQSFFNIPLVIDGKVVGVLNVSHMLAGKYLEEDMTILYEITSQATASVEQLQAVVRSEQEKINAMVGSMNEGVIMTDTDLRIVVANPVARLLISATTNERVTIFDYMDKFKDIYDVRKHLEESIKLDRVTHTRDVLVDDRFFDVVVSPVKSSYGFDGEHVLGSVVILRDRTREKLLEQMRDDFTSMIVHELRSPLYGIRSISESLMTNKTLDTDSKAQYRQMIHHSASKMLDLVNDLLDVAKLESGKFDINKEPGNIQETIERSATFYKESAKTSKIKLTKQISTNLPEIAEYDEFRITQVLNNLLSNALKFTAEGGSIKIQAFSFEENFSIAKEAGKVGADWAIDGRGHDVLQQFANRLVIAVTDTGIGMDEQQIERLFHKFKQFAYSVRNNTNAEKGTGLGLVIVKGIVDAHGGVVGLISKKNAGSTFYFTIPFEPEHVNKIGI